MDFASFVKSLGFDVDTLTDVQRDRLQAQFDGRNPPEPTPAPTPRPAPAPTPAPGPSAGSAKPDATFDATMQAIEAEDARVTRIRELVSTTAQANIGNTEKIKQLKEMGEAAVADKRTSVRDFELALLRFDRLAGTMILTPRAQAVTNDVVEAAVCRAGGLQSLEKQFSAQTLESARAQFKGGIGLLELVGLAARQGGFSGNVKSNLATALRAAKNADPLTNGNGEMMNLGASTLAISGILSNVANKFVREAFMFGEMEWRKITAIRSVSDFKQISTYSLTGDLTYEEVAPGGEIKHGTLGNETYNNQAKTYGKLLGIDRRDLINDDLGALSSVSKRLGRGAILKINDVFWTAFLNNSTFFTSGRGNYDDGTDTAFGNDGLVAADVIWRAMTDPDGKPMGHMAKILLVPPGHRIPALRLMNSQQLLATGEEGDKNPWAGMFQVVSSVYMSNSSYTGYSALAWYMLCDPQDIPVIETCFLNGAEMPTIETADLDFDRLGIALRGYHDFGVALQEYRGGLKLKGEA